MSAPCRNCSGPLPPDSATQRKFCEDRDCKRDRKRKNEGARRKRNLEGPWRERKYEPRKYGPERWDHLPPWNVPPLRVNEYIESYGCGGPKVPPDLQKVRDDVEARREALMDLLQDQALVDDAELSELAELLQVDQGDDVDELEMAA